MIEIRLESDLKDAFNQIGLIAKGSMIEQSSKAGNKVRENSRAVLRASTTPWRQKWERGKRKIYKSNFSNMLGKRIAHRKQANEDDPKNMANFITSKTMETTGTTVIGGAHKAFAPNTYRDGKIVGTQKRVGAVDKRTLAILNKLNYGTVDSSLKQHLRWRRKDGGYSNESIEEFKGKWKGRRFMEAGWRMSQGYIQTSMTAELERLIGKRVNNIKAKKETYAS